jgi:hypothetical protein
VRPDLTYAAARPLPSTRRGDAGSGALVAGDAAHLVWSAALENEALFALLDAATLRADPAVIRVRAARPGSLAFALASTRFVMAWLAPDNLVRYSVIDW